MAKGDIKGKYCQTCNRHESEFNSWDSGSNGALKCQKCGNEYRRKRRLQKQKLTCCRCKKEKSKIDFIKLSIKYTKICKTCYKKAREQYENIKYSSMGTLGNMAKDGYYLCNICNNIKPKKAFKKRKRNKSGVTSACKGCLKTRHREKKLKYTYGLSIDDFNKLYEYQGGKCAICKINLEKGTNDCSVDHNHESGNVRGLLCNRCNRAIGMLKDSKVVLYSAIRYLTSSPFQKLGEFRESPDMDNTDPS